MYESWVISNSFIRAVYRHIVKPRTLDCAEPVFYSTRCASRPARIYPSAEPPLMPWFATLGNYIALHHSVASSGERFTPQKIWGSWRPTLRSIARENQRLGLPISGYWQWPQHLRDSVHSPGVLSYWAGSLQSSRRLCYTERKGEEPNYGKIELLLQTSMRRWFALRHSCKILRGKKVSVEMKRSWVQAMEQIFCSEHYPRKGHQ